MDLHCLFWRHYHCCCGRRGFSCCPPTKTINGMNQVVASTPQPRTMWPVETFFPTLPPKDKVNTISLLVCRLHTPTTFRPNSFERSYELALPRRHGLPWRHFLFAFLRLVLNAPRTTWPIYLGVEAFPWDRFHKKQHIAVVSEK